MINLELVSEANQRCISISKEIQTYEALQKTYDLYERQSKRRITGCLENCIAIPLVIWLIGSLFVWAYSTMLGIKANIIFWAISTVFIIPIVIFLGKWKQKSLAEKLHRELDNKRLEKEKLKEEIVLMLQESADILAVIPVDYRYPLATETIYRIFLNGRADTMKEAVNLYEEQLHR